MRGRATLAACAAVARHAARARPSAVAIGQALPLLAATMLLLGSLDTAAATAAPTAAPTAADDDDAAALGLQSANAASTPARGSLAVIGEAAFTDADLQGGGGAQAQRLSLEVRDDLRLASDWRFVFGDRLDVDYGSGGSGTGTGSVSGSGISSSGSGISSSGSGISNGGSGTGSNSGSGNGLQKINTLKQAYVSWQPRNDLLVDLGRINTREGVAFGYNPTDFFRADALRTIESLDPDSLRDERLGTVMLRGESLWTSGALTAVYAPKLASAPSTAAFSPDLGATNAAGRWLLSLTQHLTPSWSPQWLLFGNDQGMPQFGFDSTALLGDATVAYLEASGGHLASLWTQSQNLPADPAWRARAAAGLTYSTTHKIALTLEYEYDGAARGARGWAAARTGDPQAYGLYRNYVTAQQELPTRQALFAYASWQDVGIRHLDWSAFLRLDLVDHSRLPWTEMRYHFTRVDLALRWQDETGARTSDYGAAPTGKTWQLVADYFW